MTLTFRALGAAAVAIGTARRSCLTSPTGKSWKAYYATRARPSALAIPPPTGTGGILVRRHPSEPVARNRGAIHIGRDTSPLAIQENSVFAISMPAHQPDALLGSVNKRKLHHRFARRCSRVSVNFAAARSVLTPRASDMIPLGASLIA